MRKMAPFALSLLSACAATTTASGGEPSGPCNAASVQSALGRPFTVELVADLEGKSGARTSRVIRPGQAVTMDYRPDRLNIELDASDKVAGVKCG